MESSSPLPEPDVVSAQYERWSYPPPVAELEKLDLSGPHSNYKDFRALHLAYWPTESYREDKDILVAGCGTMAGACYAYLYPQARVVGIDISTASLAHEQFLKEKYQLANLTLHRCAVEHVGSLGMEFDFIAVHGVLHHLADPDAGLRALAKILRSEGVVAIMVYAKYGRAGVYMLQDFFRLLGLGQETSDLEIVRQTLSVIGPRHPIQPYLQVATDLQADSGLVDTFLHRRDKPYSVRDCLDLLAAADLVFQGWDENIFYYPDIAFGNLPRESALRSRFDVMPEHDTWQAMELFGARNPGHFFYACCADREPQTYRVQFDDDAFLSFVPVPRFTKFQPTNPAFRSPAVLQRVPLPAVGLNSLQEALISQVDARRTIRECLDRSQLAARADAIELARSFFRLCWRLGYLLFQLPRAGR